MGTIASFEMKENRKCWQIINFLKTHQECVALSSADFIQMPCIETKVRTFLDLIHRHIESRWAIPSALSKICLFLRSASSALLLRGRDVYPIPYIYNSNQAIHF